MARGHRERIRAEKRFQDVRGLANAVLFELHDAIMPLPGSTQARELLVKRAQQYLDSLASESAGDDGLQRERAMAYERIGDVLGLPVQANLGHSAEALVSYRKGLEIEKGLVSADPVNESLRRDLARLYNRICRVEENTGKFQRIRCNRAAEAAASIQKVLARPAPERYRLARRSGRHSSEHGREPTSRSAIGRTPRSSAATRSRNSRNFTGCSRRAKPSSTAWPTPTIAWPIYRSRPSTLPRPATNILEAIRLFNLSSERYPKDIRKRLDWTFAQQRLGSILISMGDLKGALDAFQKALPIREQLRALDPRDARAQINLANSHASIGFVLLETGNALAARGHFEQQRKIDEELIRLDPMAVSHRYSLSEACENLGRVADRLGQKKQANALLNDALKIYDELQSRGAISAEYAAVPPASKKNSAK